MKTKLNLLAVYYDAAPFALNGTIGTTKIIYLNK